MPGDGKYLYNGKVLQQSDIDEGAAASKLDEATYLQKAGITPLADSYNYNGKTLAAADVVDGANQSKLDFNTYLQKAGIKPITNTVETDQPDQSYAIDFVPKDFIKPTTAPPISFEGPKIGTAPPPNIPTKPQIVDAAKNTINQWIPKVAPTVTQPKIQSSFNSTNPIQDVTAQATQQQDQDMLQKVQAGDPVAIATFTNKINAKADADISVLKTHTGSAYGTAPNPHYLSKEVQAQIDKVNADRNTAIQSMNAYKDYAAVENAKNLPGGLYDKNNIIKIGTDKNTQVDENGYPVNPTFDNDKTAKTVQNYNDYTSGLNTVMNSYTQDYAEQAQKYRETGDLTYKTLADDTKKQIDKTQQLADKASDDYFPVRLYQMQKVLGDVIADNKTIGGFNTDGDIKQGITDLKEKYGDDFIKKNQDVLDFIQQHGGVPASGVGGAFNRGGVEGVQGIINSLGDLTGLRNEDDRKADELNSTVNAWQQGTSESGESPTKIVVDKDNKAFKLAANENYGATDFNSTIEHAAKMTAGIVPFIAATEFGGELFGMGAKAAEGSDAIYGTGKLIAGSINPMAKTIVSNIIGNTLVQHDNNLKVADQLVDDESGAGDMKKSMMATIMDLGQATAFTVLPVNKLVRDNFTMNLGKDALEYINSVGKEGLSKEGIQQFIQDKVIPRIQSFVGQGVKLPAELTAINHVNNLAGTLFGKNGSGKTDAQLSDDDINTVKDASLLNLVFGGVGALTGKSMTARDAIYDVAGNADENTARVKAMVASGDMDPIKANALLNVINVAKANLPDVLNSKNDAGLPLTTKQYKDLLAAKVTKSLADNSAKATTSEPAAEQFKQASTQSEDVANNILKLITQEPIHEHPFLQAIGVKNPSELDTTKDYVVSKDLVPDNLKRKGTPIPGTNNVSINGKDILNGFENIEMPKEKEQHPQTANDLLAQAIVKGDLGGLNMNPDDEDLLKFLSYQAQNLTTDGKPSTTENSSPEKAYESAVNAVKGNKALIDAAIEKFPAPKEQVPVSSMSDKNNDPKLDKITSDVQEDNDFKLHKVLSKRQFAKEFDFNGVPTEGRDRIKYLKYRNEYLDAVLTKLEFHPNAADSEAWHDLHDRLEDEYDNNSEEIKADKSKGKPEPEKKEVPVSSTENNIKPANETIKPTPDFQTMDLGDWAGTKEDDEAKQNMKTVMTEGDLKSGGKVVDGKLQPGTGETGDEFKQRVIPAFKKILKTGEDNTTITTHSSVLKAMKVWDEMGRPSIDEITKGGKRFDEFNDKYNNEETKNGDVETFKGTNGDIHVVRHGETKDNELNNLRSGDTPLTAKGIKDAELAGQELNKRTNGNVPAIITSDLPRAVHTSNIISDQLKPEVKPEPKEIKLSDKQIVINDLLDKVNKYNRMANGRMGKDTPAGRAALNEIRKIINDNNFKGGNQARTSGVFRNALKDESGNKLQRVAENENANKGVKSDFSGLSDRKQSTQDTFNELVEAGKKVDDPTSFLPTDFTGTDGKKLSQKQLKSAVDDIINDRPTNQAHLVLDQFEKMVDDKEARFNDPINGKQAYPMEDHMNIVRGLEPELTPEEKEAAPDLIKKSEAQKIIDENGLTLDNLENNKHLFNGFPFTPEDFENIKKELNGTGSDSTEPGQPGQSGSGTDSNQEPGDDGEIPRTPPGVYGGGENKIPEEELPDNTPDKGTGSGDNDTSRPTETNVKELKLAHDKAVSDLKEAEDKIAGIKGKQLGIDEAAQPDMFGVKPEEAKSILDPLRQKVKETKEAYDKAANELQNYKDRGQPGLFDNAGDAKADVIKNFNDKVDEVANKWIDALTPDSLKGKDIKAAGPTVTSLIKGAAEIIKAGYKAGHDIKDIIENAIQHVKDGWDAAWGKLDEDKLRTILTDGLEKKLKENEENKTFTKEKIEATLKASAKNHTFLKSIADSSIVTGIKKIFKGTINAFHPFLFDKGGQARDAAGIIRVNKSIESHENTVADEESKKALNFWNKQKRVDNVAFMLGMENPDKFGTVDNSLRQLAQAYRDRMDRVFDMISKIKDVNFIDDYFPHFWKDPEKAKTTMPNLGKTPLEGNKSFLKQRFYSNIMDGLQAGLQLATYNPEEMVRLAEQNALHFKTANDIFNQLKDAGLVKYFDANKAPDGWTKIDDPIFNPKITDQIGGGGYYGRDATAAVLNNFTKKGLFNRGGAVGTITSGIRYYNNVKNLVQLGIGLFHFTTTSIDATVTGWANAMKEITTGKPLLMAKGAFDLVKSATVLPNLIETAARGLKANADYKAGNITPEVQNLIDAGARVRMQKMYSIDAAYNAKKSWSNFLADHKPADLGKAAWHGMWTIPEKLIGNLLMNHWVPALKTGGYLNMLKTEMAARPEMTDRELLKAKQRIWDSQDNRLGQVVYDNVFWDKTIKDLGFMSIRSLGWTGGTVKAFGTGIADLSKSLSTNLAKGKGLEHTSAWMLALPVAVGVYGGLYHYMMTGKPPQDLKDYYLPKDGTQNADGTDHRVTLPSYMKDVNSYGKDPLQTISHKASPFVNDMIETWQNQDFYHTRIWNPQDPAYQKGLDYLKYQAGTMEPFSLKQPSGDPSKNFFENVATTKGTERVFGVMDAPKEMERTDLQNAIKKAAAEKYSNEVQTKDDADRFGARYEIKKALRAGTDIKDIPQELIKKSGYTPAGLKQTLQESKHDPYQMEFKYLDSEHQLNIWKDMKPEDKKQYATFLHKGEYFNKLEEEKPELFNNKPELKDAIEDMKKYRGTQSNATSKPAPIDYSKLR